MIDGSRLRLTALMLALQGSACTADLLPTPMDDAGTAFTPNEDRPRRTSGAAGARARRPVEGEIAVAGSPGPTVRGLDTLEPPVQGSEDAGVGDTPDAASPTPDAPPPPVTVPESSRPPPSAADACITDVSPGDHNYTCDGLTYLLQIDPACGRAPCGLIVDLHGRGMSVQQMRDTTRLHALAPSHGYLVLHPSATPEAVGGIWTEAMYPQVAAFIERVIRVFGVDPSRVHVTGFSDGADITFWFLCNHPELFASAAAVSRLLPAADCIGRNWKRRVPILYMHGEQDTLTILQARAMIDDVVTRLDLGDAIEVTVAAEYTRRRWSASQMTLEYIEHAYSRLLGAGHCVPSGPVVLGDGTSVSAPSCTLGEVQLHWGELALRWFREHPRPPRPDAGP